jgi:hypothetical protein
MIFLASQVFAPSPDDFMWVLTAGVVLVGWIVFACWIVDKNWPEAK